MHGSRAPQVKAASERRLQEAEARKDIQRLGLAVEAEPIDPRDALSEELARTQASVLVLEGLVSELGLDEGGIYARTFHVSGRATGEAKPHVLVSMWQAERGHLTQVAVAAAKAGVEERRVAMEQERGQLIADLIRAVAGDPELGLEPARRRVMLTVAARHLRGLAGPPLLSA